jgi:RNA recognition motif-containing protein
MNIYVSNISFSVTEDDLSQVFAEFGNVTSVKIITDKFTGKSRGFGFVEMSDDSEAQSAIQELNGSEFAGRELQVKEALPKKDNFGGSSNNKGGGGKFSNSKKNDYYSKGNKKY